MTDRRTIASGVLVALVAVLLAAILAPSLGSAQNQTTTAETVTVTAAGKVEGEPDLAAVVFGVRGEAATADAAMDELAAKTDRVFNALLQLGLTEDQITTQQVSLHADYDHVDGRRVFRAYVASTGIRAETRKLDQVGQIIDTGVEAGADSIRGVFFELTDRNAALQEALREAMELARMKAEVLATTAGRTLGRALIIEEGGAQAPRPVAFDVAARPAPQAAATLRISPPKQTTVVRIVVTFALQ